MKTKKKVIIAMSGGIDSSVAAAILKKQGYECVGVYMQFWMDAKSGKKAAENKCCSYESMRRAQNIAKKLGIPACVLNVSSQFKKKVVDYFICEHEKCRTPNPCIECNRNIKFGELLDWAKQMGADFVATGHYARIVKNGNKYELHAGKDKDKDQSYFLYTLTQTKLRHIIFPVGGYTKTQVRKLAKKYGIPETTEIKESQGICFFPEKDHTEFLKRHLHGKYFKKGAIRISSGEILGKHDGLPLYTIGQRKGIKLGGVKDPWYVTGFDTSKNALIIGKNKDTFQKELKVSNITFVSGKPREKTIKIKTKIRHRAESKPAILEINGNKGKLTFTKGQRAIMKGQSVVFYKGSKVLGGGVIA